MAAAPVSFDYVEIDPYISGDVKLVGDIDGDGYPDLVMGGMPGEKLNWYRYPNWEKTVIHTPGNEYTTDGALGDIDGDGDLDIIAPDGNSGDNLRWFENPRPSGDPTIGSQWSEHTIGSVGDWGKDVYVSDYDSNGRMDVATRQENAAMIFFQTGANVWTKMTFSGLDLGHEGMTSGRVDNDNNEDLVLHGVWVRNPGGTAARTASNWTQYTIGNANSDFKALVVDLDKDGVTDVLFSSSENTDEVVWYEPTNGNPTGSWTKHTIVASLERAHTLQVADMDLDGDNDVVLGQMHTSSAKELMIMENVNGQATSWQKQVIDNTGLHNGVVADIGNDGDYDIFGANWTGNPPVKLYVNQTVTTSLDEWTYKQVTSSHAQTFGLTFGDVNGDGPKDIISGGYWYKNPGGDMLGNWVQSPLPSGMHAILTVDVDGDSNIDLIAQQTQGGNLALYWLEATNSAGTSWSSVQIGTVPAASHELGAQGYRVGQVEAGGRPEVLVSSGNGIYYFRIPASPGSGNWPKVQISSNPSDEGFALGDINRDFLLDVAATTGDSKRVEWYKNPGNGSANWTAYHIGDFTEALYPDRTEVGDINGDNRLDIIVTEENGEDSGAETYWWQAPSNPTNGNWSRHLVVSQATTNSMDTADMDGDNDVDIVLGEHRGAERVTIWENDGSGNLTEHLVGSGHESHLGAQTVDLDNDGDLDIVSIAYDDFQYIHLWRNDAIGSGGSPTATPTLPATTGTPSPTNTPTPSNTPPPGTTSTPTVTATPTIVCTPEPSSSAVPTTVPTAATGRVTEGQQVLYLFDAASGSTVADYSGVQPPLNLTIANPSAVSWLTNGGLDVNQGTVIQSGSSPTRLINALTDSDEITLEAWVIPNDTSQNGPARIVTLSQDAFLRNYTLGQEFNTFEIRLRTTATDNNGFPVLTSPSGSAATNLTHVVYTRRANGQVRLYINNNVAATETRDGDFSNWASQYKLALANELTLDRPWLGTFHLVAIYNRYLTAAEVEQNYEAGPRPSAAEREANSAAYLPVVVGNGGCGQSAVVSDSSAAPNVTRDEITQSTIGTSQPITWIIGVIAALAVIGIGALGIHYLRMSPQPNHE
ncbi:MAG: FG-GAP-like repeat-containing protein [Candidatus Promineifilaceae bacterium]